MLKVPYMTIYCIDLDEPKHRLDVTYFSDNALKSELKAYNCRSYEGLNSFDRRVFDNLGDAQKYLKKYLDKLGELERGELCQSKGLPALRYFRRYLVLSALGEKLHTHRSYGKNWKKGQLFNFHDQTYFLTVELEKLTQENETTFRYDFKIPQATR